MTDSPAGSGLCESCRWGRPIRTRRGSSFMLCALSREDPEYARYPRLPVRDCDGYAPQRAGEGHGPGSASG